ncbi:iron-sulfur binding protein [Solidesulfovibrio carbinoliphilus subsp. oakridgensis]|uniref:Iron-sulfur binding protein n=1 Tax=Solidesulfovibrio carbinoliphilus subsp. oakridgensis TaxID=694327 RepID=G7QBD7_9BACT|nr:4Fe-4S binding protein [Solidesulfovibrio carbinoliphilus]EHJ49360.1 iron-sulfur binding protein [Solidesulfovibrio carbinoliphilus subsp. oakridgensis]
MRIVTARRISQGFFLVLFLWFCVVATVGDRFWQLRGWPVNWLLWLDPLTALATTLATRTLFAPLLWAVAVFALTFFVGRFFCGFACPLGTLQHLAGYLSRRHTGRAARIEANRPSRWQALKYYGLVFFLTAAALGSVQTGLLDPLPLVYRSVSLALLPLVDPGRGVIHHDARFYDGAWVFGAVFVAILALNFLRPRFFCRFLCPLGALFGLATRLAPWRIGKRSEKSCGNCHLCEEYCEGGCRPSGEILQSECVLCCNCLDACPTGRIGFAGRPSVAGERALPDVSRRGAVAVLAVGALTVPLWRVGGAMGAGRDPSLLRPPGALDEERFLARCIRCGQCMRVCPSNIIQPAVTVAGAAGIWTPTLNYRLGRAGCLQNCIACGQVCPTAAIRPLGIDEKLGIGDFAATGPIRLGTAFVDRTRCLPWAMGRPCIVCQEVCPVSPKAIYTQEVFEPVRGGRLALADARGAVLSLAAPFAADRNLGSGDYYLRPSGIPGARPLRIAGLTATELTLERPLPDLGQGREADILVRLQQPHVDPGKCIGCGMCEHECPVSGLRAIRVTSENESRSGPGRMLA